MKLRVPGGSLPQLRAAAALVEIHYLHQVDSMICHDVIYELIGKNIPDVLLCNIYIYIHRFQ